MNIEDYGFIGDMHAGALVGRDGSIDWLCWPRFDADACFAALLGSESNGRWLIQPAAGEWHAEQKYRADSLVLETVFETADGTMAVIDCMPVNASHRQIIRIVEGRRGTVTCVMKLVVRFDNGLSVPWVQRIDGVLRAIAGPNAVSLVTDVPTRGENLSTVADFTVTAGEQKILILAWHPSHEPTPQLGDALELLASTERSWRAWARQCTYRGPHREAVMRSLITLKALTFAPTGGIVAALTTSLPEALGGVRNWDYRYCWLRDATLTLYSLMEAGYTEEAAAWINWLLRAVAGDPAQLQIMYGAAGERSLPELEIKHLAGYEGARPVRKGNAAVDQFQLDVYGEVMDAMHQARRLGLVLHEQAWHLERHLVDYVAANWMRPDLGIWEMRGPSRHFTHSKVMAWVALDRAIRSVEAFGLAGDVVAWRNLRDVIHADVCEKGFNATRGVFTQFYGSDALDAALLQIPLVGFLPADDARVTRTIEAIATELMENGLIRRYHPQESAYVDGLPPGEGTFLPCSFWLVDCYCLLGRKAEAEKLFNQLLAIRSPLGLLAEEYEPRLQRQLGNYPQAFSHVGLVNSALNLARRLGPASERSATDEAPSEASRPPQ
ncbi:MAG: glucoamylase [Opitutus sp.]|nr:glucoamylase [Opitutus sp.]